MVWISFPEASHIYRSPSSSKSNDTSLLHLLKQVQGLGVTYTLITGNFNSLSIATLIGAIGLHQNGIQQEILTLKL